MLCILVDIKFWENFEENSKIIILRNSKKLLSDFYVHYFGEGSPLGVPTWFQWLGDVSSIVAPVG